MEERNSQVLYTRVSMVATVKIVVLNFTASNFNNFYRVASQTANLLFLGTQMWIPFYYKTAGSIIWH